MKERKWPRFAVLLMLMAMVATACGDSSTDPSAEDTAKKSGPTITLGGFGFAESTLLVEIYGQALAAKGYTVEKKTNIGSREVVQPALAKGDLDFVPEYLNTVLEFLKGEGTAETTTALERVQPLLDAKELQALTPAPAQNRNEFVVTKATAEKHRLTKLSDLAAVDETLTLGGPPECPERPLCLKGLESTYGLKFKSFEKLDAGGPLTVTALDKGEVDVGLLFTTDGAIAAKGFVVLEDDKKLQGADNIVPIVRDEVVTAYGDEFVQFVDSVTAKLTSQQLQEMNKKISIDKEDPDAVAKQWLGDNGFAV